MDYHKIQVSIIIPCYNQSSYLTDCFDSLFIQSNFTWEAILVNDGSTDNTELFGINLVKKDSRVKYIFQENKGLSVARNTGMQNAIGQYLLFLDADDWLEPDCLSSFSSFIQSNPGFDMYRCGYSYWNKPQDLNFHTHLPLRSHGIWPQVLTNNIGPCHSIFINRTFAEQLGGFDPFLKSCEDWDFWIRAGKMGAKVVSVPKVLVAYRYVPESMSRNPKQMYLSLCIVSTRAAKFDKRIFSEAPFNRDYKLDSIELAKAYFIKCLGVCLFQGKLSEGVSWYFEEIEKFAWSFTESDWLGISSNLTFKYFLSPVLIDKVLNDTYPVIFSFFLSIGYSDKVAKSIVINIFAPQLKKQNHLRYGKFLGSLINRVKF